MAKGESYSDFTYRLQQKQKSYDTRSYAFKVSFDRAIYWATRYEEDPISAGRRGSLQSRSVTLSILASGLIKLAYARLDGQLEGRIQWLNATPTAILRLMSVMLKVMRSKRQQLLDAGINPQSEITVRPYLERARRAAEFWRTGVPPSRYGGERSGLVKGLSSSFDSEVDK